MIYNSLANFVHLYCYLYSIFRILWHTQKKLEHILVFNLRQAREIIHSHSRESNWISSGLSQKEKRTQ